MIVIKEIKKTVFKKYYINNLMIPLKKNKLDNVHGCKASPMFDREEKN